MNPFLPAAIILVLVATLSSNSTFAYSDPMHCHGYNACFTIVYSDGYSDAQNGVSPAYACEGHSNSWCTGYTEGFRASNGGNNIYYGADARQSASVDVHGDNNKISINQQSSNQEGDNEEFSEQIIK